MSNPETMSIRDAIYKFACENDKPFKKDIVDISGVSNDRLSRVVDMSNGGKVVDLIAVLNSLGYELAATKKGGVTILTMGDK